MGLVSAMLNSKLKPLSGILALLRVSAAHLVRSDSPVARAKPRVREWSLELLKQLEWRRFEELCVAYFEALGFGTRLGQAGAEGGVDIHLCAAGAERASILVQCKAWNAYRIGARPVRELQRAMRAAGLEEAMLVTSGRFTQEAVACAAAEKLQLVDGAALLARFAALAPERSAELLEFATHGDYLTPTCPSCSLKMTSRKSTREGRTFWGCRNYPRCKHTFPAST